MARFLALPVHLEIESGHWMTGSSRKGASASCNFRMGPTRCVYRLLDPDSSWWLWGQELSKRRCAGWGHLLAVLSARVFWSMLLPIWMQKPGFPCPRLCPLGPRTKVPIREEPSVFILLPHLYCGDGGREGGGQEGEALEGGETHFLTPM